MMFSNQALLRKEKVSPEEVDPNTKYIGLEHIGEGTLSLNGFGYSSDVNSSKAVFEKGDILFGKLRPYFRKVIIAPFDGICSTDIWVVKPKNGIDRNFLFYWMASQDFVDDVTRSSEGTRMPRAKWEVASKIEIPDVEITQQKKIGEILYTLDQKIHLNQQTNETLEAMAQAIFKSWFVDFDPVRAKIKATSAGRDPNRAAMASITGVSLHQDWDAIEAVLQQKLDRMSDDQRTQLRQTAELFPDELVKSEIGEVPKGWGYQQAQEIADIGIGKTPPRKEKHWFSNSDKDVKWVSIKDMGTYGIYALNTLEYLTREAIEEKNVRVVPDNTVILSFKMTIGRTAITIGKMTTNEAIAHFKLGDKPQLSSKYLFLYLSQFEFNALGSTSSIAMAINSKIVKKMPILVPQKEMVVSFTEVVEPIFRKIKSNSLEVETLSQLRDLLLPKLISGEVGV